ncbi:hypothetical protein SCMC78_34560 [Streptomyces sp. CMC78]|uniref:Vegetative cell wall protein gp1 n=1 Tax=Streptomyces sp. CMC78 TaxID=3231512 RepID=A0AB33KJL8_9ACTN
MNTFLVELATRLMDRWLTALVAPGLLWMAVLVSATRLGQTTPFELVRLSDWLVSLSRQPALQTTAVAILLAVTVVLAAGVVGLLAGALGGLAERCWALLGVLPPAAWLLEARRRRWDGATRRLRGAILQAAERDAQGADAGRADALALRRRRQRDRLGPARPVRPTRIGDRYARTAERVRRVNGLDDLALVWPRLWTVLPDPLRTEIAAARVGTSDAARLFGWGTLYLALSVCWWPAALLGTAIFAVATVRARSTSENLSALIETAVDLHSADLSERLGLPAASSQVAAGQAITDQLRGAPSRDDASTAD